MISPPPRARGPVEAAHDIDGPSGDDINIGIDQGTVAASPITTVLNAVYITDDTVGNEPYLRDERKSL